MRRKNKKGMIGIIMFFVALLLILILAFIGAVVIGIGGFTADLITPIMTDLGTVGGTNVSAAAEATFTPVDTIVNAFPWLLGICFVAALLFSIGFAASLTISPNPFFIGLYFMLMILLIFGTIIMSNIYEDIYTGNDDIATSLQEQPLTSHLILYSPFILTLIATITGIYMFAKPNDAGGGFGV